MPRKIYRKLFENSGINQKTIKSDITASDLVNTKRPDQRTTGSDPKTFESDYKELLKADEIRQIYQRK